MGILSQRIEPHWNYLLALDADLVTVSRYVEFHRENFQCFSIELARLLLAAASEADVVGKRLCRLLKGPASANSIRTYRNAIRRAYPTIHQFEVLVPRFGLVLRPWDEWKHKAGVPVWWTAYNKVKHQRDVHYEKASLHNTLNAVAGLFVLVLYLLRDDAREGGLVPAPQLLRVGEQHYGGQVVGLNDAGLCYELEEPKVGRP
jgi:hypothetical protein